MIIGCLKEIKDNENRVGLTPQGASQLVNAGHTVLVQEGAGMGSWLADEHYRLAGATLVKDPAELVKGVDILVKVKEPLPSEYHLLDLLKNKVLFTYLHLAAADRRLTEKLCDNSITAVAYETIEDTNHLLPLLKPMSEIAGVLAVEYGAIYLQRKHGGRGMTLGEIENTPSAKVVVFGGGVVGSTAGRTAAGMGSSVVLFDIDDAKIAKLQLLMKEKLGPLARNIQVLNSRTADLKKHVIEADLLIGAVLVPGTKAPLVVGKELVDLMKKGSVIVDVAIDQGGCVFGARQTSHSIPVYELDGKIYCCIPNMPGQASFQSTQALTAATMPYLKRMATEGVKAIAESDAGFAMGINCSDGKIRYKPVAEGLGMMARYEPI